MRMVETLIIKFFALYGRNLDKPIPDTDEIEIIYSNKF